MDEIGNDLGNMNRTIKCAKGGKVAQANSNSPTNGKQEAAKTTPFLPPIDSNRNGNGGRCNWNSKSKLNTPTRTPAFPSLSLDNPHPPATPSGRSSRKASASQSPQVAEFAYSKAVEYALRKYGFWSGRRYPHGYRSRYLEADIPRLPDIYKDYVSMRKCQTRHELEPRDMRRAVYRSYDEPLRTEQTLPLRTPVGRDTPMPKSLVSAMGQQALPSIAMEVCLKAGRPDSCSSASISV